MDENNQNQAFGQVYIEQTSKLYHRQDKLIEDLVSIIANDANHQEFWLEWQTQYERDLQNAMDIQKAVEKEEDISLLEQNMRNIITIKNLYIDKLIILIEEIEALQYEKILQENEFIQIDESNQKKQQPIQTSIQETLNYQDEGQFFDLQLTYLDCNMDVHKVVTE